MTVRLKAAAFQNHIQDADCGGRFELELLSGFIIIYQERTVNDIAEISLMIVPILTRQLSGYIRELLGEIVTGNAVVLLQHGRHRLNVPFLQLP